MATIGRPKRKGRKPENGVRMRQVSLCLTPGERRKLGARAKRDGLSFSSWSRRALLSAAESKT